MIDPRWRTGQLPTSWKASEGQAELLWLHGECMV